MTRVSAIDTVVTAASSAAERAPVSVVRRFASSACPRTAAVSPARLWRVCFCARRRARYFSAHPVDPQRRAIGQVVELVGGGGLIAYPTDPCLALGCRLAIPRACSDPILW